MDNVYWRTYEAAAAANSTAAVVARSLAHETEHLFGLHCQLSGNITNASNSVYQFISN